MAENQEKSSKVGSAEAIEIEDFGHRLIRLEGEVREFRRRSIIYERRLIAWETHGIPLKIGEGSRGLPTLDAITRELDRSVAERNVDITALEERVKRLEEASRNPVTERDGRAVTGRDVTERDGESDGESDGERDGALRSPMTPAERAKAYRDRLRREADRREEDSDGSGG